ncbi:MAG: glycosyltransferase family 2 protein [Candidatus Poseidoniales archaeon]|nr:MAG: glycosyltransferase family 2 protein [Candidatus Poseidoniales archaeon]
MLEGHHIAVVVPARNEEEHISQVIETLPEYVDLVVIVNDGSNDQTQKRAQEATSPCQLVILENGGKGVGSAIDCGHQYVLEHLSKPFVSAVMAGDGQMNPGDLMAVVQPIVTGYADHVKGNRRAHEEGYNLMPTARKRASSILGFFTTLASGQPIEDPQCGFTATSSLVLESWDWNRSWKGYGYPNYWIINLSRNGWRIAHVPVESIYKDETSGIKALPFFTKVGVMMAIEHHRRNLAWLKPRNLTPHTLFALLAYCLGWSAFLPGISNDLENELMLRGVPMILVGIFFWYMAHIFDRMAVRMHRELRS